MTDDFETILIGAPNEYSSMIMHDIKNCAIAINPFLDLEESAIGRDDHERGEKYRERAKRQVIRLNMLIDDFYDRLCPETGKLMLKARHIDMYDDVIQEILSQYSDEINEREIVIVRNGSLKNGQLTLYQDRGLLKHINRIFFKNAMDCGQGTEIDISNIHPVSSVNDECPVDGGGYAKIMIRNTIPDPRLLKEEKEGAWGLGLKYAESNITLLGGEFGQLFKKKNIGGAYYGIVEYAIPIDLRDTYPD